MEEPVGGTPPDDEEQDSGCSVVMRQRESEATATTAPGVSRRFSLAICTDLRRRGGTAAASHASGAQFKGLVVPSPAVSSVDCAKTSLSSLPTIAGTRPRSNLLLASSSQERRGGSSGYQSVLTGLPYMTSSSRSKAAETASGGQRRGSLYTCPPPSYSGVSKSFAEPPSGTTQRVNNNNNICPVVVDDKQEHLSHHTDEFREPMSTRTDGSTNCHEIVKEETSSLQANIPAHSRDTGPAADDELVPRDSLDSDVCSSSSRPPASSAVREYDVSEDKSDSEKVNSLKFGEQQPDDVDDEADVVQERRTCVYDDVDNDHRALPTSTFTGSESVDGTGTEADADSRNWERCTSARLDHEDDGLLNVVVNKGNLGLGFCIAAGRSSTTGDSAIVVKRVFKGSFIMPSVYIMCPSCCTGTLEVIEPNG